MSAVQYDSHEWRDAGEIDCITFVDVDGEGFMRVGNSGITRIEKWTKSGSMASLPYVRVWKGDVLVAEFCQHNLTGVFFKETPQ